MLARLIFVACALTATLSSPVTLPLHRRALTLDSLGAAPSFRASNGSGAPIALFSFLGAEFVANVSVGTPPVSFRMAVSTSTGNSWLATQPTRTRKGVCHAMDCGV